MIIIILSIAVLIGGIILHKNRYSYYNDMVEFLSMMMTTTGVVTLIVCSIFILLVQVNKDIDYQDALYTKEMLEYRIENMDEDIVGNEMLYNDIVAFNNSLRSTKKWANNPWTNWFNNEDIATIDYIEIEK